MRLAPAAAFLATVFVATSARAQRRPSSESARHFEAGRAALVAHDYDRAAREFEAAYAISHDPSLLFNLGVVFEDAHRFPEALDAYRRYLTMMPNAANRTDVERRVRTLEAAAAPSESSAPPPPVTIVVSSSPPPADAAPRTRGRPVAAIFVAASGAAFIVSGIVFGVLALQTRASLEQMCGGDVTQCPDSPSARGTLASLSGQSIAADVLFGVGGAAVVAGVLWYALTPVRTNDTAFVIAPGWAGIRGTF